MKIKFTCPGQSNTFMMNRVMKDFYVGQDVEVVDGFDYDWMVCVNNQTEVSNAGREKTIGVAMEPAWSLAVSQNLQNTCGTIFAHDNSLFGFNDCRVIERPALMFNEFYTTQESVDFYRNFIGEKTKKMSFVVSRIAGSSRNVLYDRRIKLAEEVIRHNLPMDIWGRGWNPDGNKIKGPVVEKRDAIIDYEFSVGIENSIEKNYITEKFFDNLLVNTVPVYFGAPNIEEVYDKRSFIHLDLNNIDNCLQTFKDILDGKYDHESYLEPIKKARETYINNHNLLSEVLKVAKGEI
jgi:hypothetical protein